jgi:hypothetical protein
MIRPSISRRKTYPRSILGFIRKISAVSFSVSNFSPIGSGLSFASYRPRFYRGAPAMLVANKTSVTDACIQARAARLEVGVSLPFPLPHLVELPRLCAAPALRHRRQGLPHAGVPWCDQHRSCRNRCAAHSLRRCTGRKSPIPALLRGRKARSKPCVARRESFNSCGRAWLRENGYACMGWPNVIQNSSMSRMMSLCIP